MEEIDLYTQLIEIDLFNLFKIQIKKDFETCGLDVNFINDLPSDFFKLKAIFINQLQPLFINKKALSNLLNRIDISETQLNNYQAKKISFSFEEIIAELIIKRTLQKVILKKRFS